MSRLRRRGEEALNRIVEWLGWVVLLSLLVLSRRFIFGRWRRYEFSHRQAAALWASATPVVLVVLFLVRGIETIEQLLFLAGLVILTFASSYAIALFFLRAFGGEMDPPSSSGYRRRP